MRYFTRLRQANREENNFRNQMVNDAMKAVNSAEWNWQYQKYPLMHYPQPQRMPLVPHELRYRVTLSDTEWYPNKS